ncbi:diguanylate cyclase domain-containing protein [Chitiniphilus shinanonensis]|uniref:diguanylate cyclase domain-containing protein n=1 Tax=Chitiniphilus shinanonensis TaxID=553088 RepID=UPI0033426383
MTRKMLRWVFAVGLAVLLLNAAIPFLVTRQAGLRHEAADAEHELGRGLSRLLRAYLDAETGERGFILTGDEAFLGPYQHGRAEVGRLLPQIAARMRPSPAVERLLHHEHLLAPQQAGRIAARRQGLLVETAAMAQGRREMDAIRNEIEALARESQQRGAVLAADTARWDAWSRISVVVVTLMDLLLIGAACLFALRAARDQRAAIAATDVANRHLLNEAAQRNEAMRQLEQHNDKLNALIATQALLAQSALDLERFLTLVTDSMLRLSPAQGVVVLLVDGEKLLCRAGSGSGAHLVGRRVPREGSLSGRCLAEQALLSAPDTESDPRVDREACRRAGARALLVAPLYQAGAAVGVLMMIGDRPDTFGPPDTQTLQLMAGLLGAALGHQRQFEENERLLAGRTQALAALERELTRRERYEQELVSSRQRTQAIIEASHEMFICIDRDGRVIDWNAQAAATFGWSKDEVVGQLLADLIVPERFRMRHQDGIAHFLRTGEGAAINRRMELPALQRNGHEILVELTITALHHGDTIEFPCFLRDISARKRAEQAQLQQQQTLRAITDAIPALVSFLDAGQRYRYWNRQYLETLGIEPAAGQTVAEFMGEEFHARIRPQIEAALRGEPAYFETTMATQRGTRYQSVNLIPHRDEQDEVAGFYVVSWDITDRKQQELAWQTLASFDTLTGALTRVFFLEALDLALRRHRRSGQPLALFYLDVDHFKPINDLHGHAAGDAVLRAYTRAIERALRESDVVGRLGGDEFCVMLDDARNEEAAIKVAEKILEAVRVPIAIEDGTLRISTSIGIAFINRTHRTPEQLVALADTALYQAKQIGRDRYALVRVDDDAGEVAG